MNDRRGALVSIETERKIVGRKTASELAKYQNYTTGLTVNVVITEAVDSEIVVYEIDVKP